MNIYRRLDSGLTRLDSLSLIQRFYLVFLLISLAWVIDLLTTNLGEIKVTDGFIFFAYVGMLALGHLGLLIGLDNLFKLTKLSLSLRNRILVSGLGVGHGFVFYSLIIALGGLQLLKYANYRVVMIISIILFCLAYHAVYRLVIIDKFFRLAFLLLFLILSYAIGKFGLTWQQDAQLKIATIQTWDDGFPKADFKKSNNIYLLSFDSLISQKNADHLMHGLQLDYPTMLKDIDFKEIDNAMTVFSPTGPSLNSLVRIKLEGFMDIAARYRHLMVSRQVNSMLYQIFTDNGYKIRVAHQGDYFGKGGNLDSYITATPSLSLCNLPSLPYSMLGACEVSKAIMTTYPGLAVFRGDGGKTWEELFLADIERTVEKKEKFLTLSYIYRPGHTLSTYRYSPENLADYQQVFQKNQQELTLDMKDLIGKIQKIDPEAIIIIFGDHGAYVSRDNRSLNEQDYIKTYDNFSEQDWYQDRRGVYLSYHDNGLCEKEFRDLKFVADIGIRIINCMAEVEAIDIQLNKAFNDKLVPYYYKD